MDEINEQTENMKQIQEALSTPIGAAADFDEVTFLYAYILSYYSAEWSLSNKKVLFDRMSLKQSLKN